MTWSNKIFTSWSLDSWRSCKFFFFLVSFFLSTNSIISTFHFLRKQKKARLPKRCWKSKELDRQWEIALLQVLGTSTITTTRTLHYCIHHLNMFSLTSTPINTSTSHDNSDPIYMSLLIPYLPQCVLPHFNHPHHLDKSTMIVTTTSYEDKEMKKQGCRGL